MLDELKNLRYSGGKEELLFFICDVVGSQCVSIDDTKIICRHTHGKRNLITEDIIEYCRAFGWVQLFHDSISVSPFLIPYLQDKDKLNEILISSTVTRLFCDQIMDASMFYYDAFRYQSAFRNERLPLPFACIRNVLISQGFFVLYRDNQGVRFYVSVHFENLIAKLCIKTRKKMALEVLKQKIDENEATGEKAELFALEYERKRLGFPLSDKVRRVSDIDVSAGYDILSFNSPLSLEADRFIEVKAVSKDGFYWSRNEYEIAKLKAANYFLYLINLSEDGRSDYVPEIIQNPSLMIIHSDSWFVEPQSFYIRRL